jgi:hypothetical protein
MLLLNDMFDKIGSIGARSSYFMDQFTTEDETISINPATFRNEIDKIDHVLDNMKKNQKNFEDKLKEWKR